MNRWLAGSLFVLVGGVVPSASAQPAWRGAAPSPLNEAVAPAPVPPPPAAYAPAATLGRPELLPPSPADSGGSEFAADRARTPVAALQPPQRAGVARAQNADSDPPLPPGRPVSSWQNDGRPPAADPFPPLPHPSPSDAITAPLTRPRSYKMSDDSAAERYNRGALTDPLFSDDAGRPRKSTSRRQLPPILGGGEGDHCGRATFQSDHAFDGDCGAAFISPVTNPFLFEDPRSLTEIRPIFMYQSIPNSGPLHGGNAEFFGLQARLALTERWSITLNKLGAVAINPSSDSYLDKNFGFAEIWVGPKFTFLRDVDNKAVGAAGVIFQIPLGSSGVFQDTGTLSVVPYVSVAKNLAWLPESYGSFNVMDTLGYSFHTGAGRSDYFYNSLHFDYDIANQHKFFPLAEVNWFHYTSSGDSRPIYGVEGRDLANIGAYGVKGENYVSLAGGMRYKFSDHASVGLAAEFPIISPKDLFNFRTTVDFIWRY
jgi:hypothetical protein